MNIEIAVAAALVAQQVVAAHVAVIALAEVIAAEAQS